MSQIRPIDKLLDPLRLFFGHELAGAGLLIGAAVMAIVWANSPWAGAYHALLELDAGVEIGGARLEKSLHHWINDGLMGIFFFAVGLEIKRELIAGELSSRRNAMLPAMAALGGMVVPALLYFSLNPSGPASTGWGIPMATDIAFALGVLALLGDRVPLGLKVFLTALAIVDDIGAVLVIAIFYTDQVSLVSLVAGFALLSVALGANLLLGVRSTVAYFVIGMGVWVAFLESGVHATVAAILMAFTIPARTYIDRAALVRETEAHVESLREVGVAQERGLNTPMQQVVLEAMARTAEHASAPLQELERVLHPLVVFVVLPVFALANAGLTLGEGLASALFESVTLGVLIGLFAGKQIGIASFAWLAVRLRIADLPRNVGWAQLYGVSLLGGIGFTMSLFIASLAFDDPARLDQAKLGVLSASLISAVVGVALLRAVSPRGVREEAPSDRSEEKRD